MNVAPISVDGWQFEITGSKLSITSEENDNLDIEISARAAFWLLNYLYQERNELQQASQREISEEVDVRKAELRKQRMQDNIVTE